MLFQEQQTFVLLGHCVCMYTPSIRLVSLNEGLLIVLFW